MSFEWSTQPLSISTIISRFSLPLLIQTAPGQLGSNRPMLLYGTTRLSFAVGNALKTGRVSKTGYESFRPIDSELIAVPLNYPGFFECLLPSRRGTDPVVLPETNLSAIIQQLKDENRSQAFYLLKPLRVFTLEKIDDNEEMNRRWKNYDAHQVVVFDKIVEIEYTPTTDDDDFTDDDYEFSWWNCFVKKILNRHEFAIQCLNNRNETFYLSFNSSNEFLLLPVGQRGSKNFHKLQTIENLIEQFPLPLNLRLSQLPSSLAYADFSSYWQLRGFHTEDFLLCASLSTTNISIIHRQTPLKFVVAVIPFLSDDDDLINSTILRCETFLQRFHLEIRRLKILFRPKAKKAKTRTLSTDSVTSIEGRKQRNHSSAAESDVESNYNSLVYPVERKSTIQSQISFTYDSGSNLIEELNSSHGHGVILIDHEHGELFSKFSFF